MKSAKFLLPIASICMLTIGVMLFWQADQKRKITEMNLIVMAQIIEAPKSCKDVTTRGGYCKLRYNGKTFGKKAGIKFCPLLEGKTEVTMLSNKNGNKLLFPNEYQFRDYIFSILICIIALIIFFKGIEISNIKQSKS